MVDTSQKLKNAKGSGGDQLMFSRLPRTNHLYTKTKQRVKATILKSTMIGCMVISTFRVNFLGLLHHNFVIDIR